MKFPRHFALTALLLLAASLSASAKERIAVVIQADFGGAVMPGVVFSVSRELLIVTVQPLIARHDIDAAARNLSYNAQTWPAGTVFVSVVDPGVGTRRQSVVLKTKNGQYFVSPDNGTLSLVAAEFGIDGVREIDESVNRRPGTEWSHTFHGRDVYAYTAARLAAGVITFEQVGPLLPPRVVALEYPAPVLAAGTATGLLHEASEDGFGNVSCLIDRHTFAQLGLHEGDLVVATVRHSGQTVWEETVPYVKTFGEVAVGKNLLFVNSSGYVSLAINQGNFSQTYKIGSGHGWSISVRKK
ncbi:MAG: SAM-dependent chlorinase/fluorinase [Opitutae bacterium]|nr:SAM-dependent chlorinase/fluorinase [Opitutae bacterium]